MSSPTIFQGSILDADVDVIVNPANSFLNHGGGLARIIDKAAAPTARVNGYDEPKTEKGRIWLAEQSGQVPTGGAVLTSAGELPFKAVIHAVGPIWGGGEYLERSLLYSAYVHALWLAEEHGFNSIAFPAISAGIFGVPITTVATAAVAATSAAEIDVVFALMDESHVEAFKIALGLPAYQEV